MTTELTRDDARAIARILYAIDQRIAAEQAEAAETQPGKGSRVHDAARAEGGGDGG